MPAKLHLQGGTSRALLQAYEPPPCGLMLPREAPGSVCDDVCSFWCQAAGIDSFDDWAVRGTKPLLQPHVRASSLKPNADPDTYKPFAACRGQALNEVRLTGTGYFEVHILPSTSAHPQAPTHTAAGGSERPCVAVGVCTDEFNQHTGRMPGWTSNSIALHGDDGRIYHGHGRPVSWLQAGWASPFGVGQVVGCGLTYSSAAKALFLFFTVDGAFVGVGAQLDAQVSPGTMSWGVRAYRSNVGQDVLQPFYPVVGCDAVLDVRVNVGQHPFLFDPDTASNLVNWPDARVLPRILLEQLFREEGDDSDTDSEAEDDASDD